MLLWPYDPLTEWLGLAIDRRKAYFDGAPALQQEMRELLRGLERYVAQTPRERVDFYAAEHPPLWAHVPQEDLPRAQALYVTLAQMGGTGTTMMQEDILRCIALTRDEVTVPFWVEMLDLRIPREKFRHARRLRATAALALLIIQRDSSDAAEALMEATKHRDADVRALATYHLGRAYLWPGRPVPPAFVELMGRLASEDASFEPRFQARAILGALGLPAPFDNPDGVYAFKVKLGWYKEITRTIDMLSEQTLFDLQWAIQESLGWDNDHEYAFYMAGQRYDPLYEFAGPDILDDRVPASLAVIGELGLFLKQKFTYVYDLQEEHEFEVEVVGIQAQADDDEYPRLLRSQGMMPRQYGFDC